MNLPAGRADASAVPGAGAPVEVRVARPDDLAQAGALTAEAYHADRLLDGDDEYEVELRDAERRSREAVLLVAATGDVVVGTLTLAPYGSSYAEVAAPGEAELRMLAVAPEVRRRGVAERLVVAALREVVGRGTGRVVLSTLDSMHAAHRLYERLGFVAAPDRDWGHEGVALRVLTWRAPDAPGALVESATWTPARTVQVDGWRVGVSAGFTRRANSVLPLGEPADLEAAVRRAEDVLAAEGLPAVFRVCDAAPTGLDALLDARGYAAVAATDVLVHDLDGDRAAATVGGTTSATMTTNGTTAPSGGDDGTRGTRRTAPTSPPRVRVGVADRPDDVWLDGWLAVKAAAHPVDRAVPRAVVTGSRALYLTAVDTSGDDAVVGVLRAAFAEDWVGLSCLMVAPGARRRGIGRLLTERALVAAAERGARRAFLQVEVGNVGAADLYASAGFRPAARYHYRQR
ncbi:MAG TPA: GNAT family N-acetyltransferase [Cellulomonas sp.]